MGVKPAVGSLIAVDEHHGIGDGESGAPQRLTGGDDGAAGGDEVVNDDDGLSGQVAALDTRRVADFGRVDINHGLVGDEREAGGYMQTAKGDSRHEVERAAARMPHGGAGLCLGVDQVGGGPQGPGIADEDLGVEEDRGIDGAAAYGEVAELNAAKLVDGPRQPEAGQLVGRVCRHYAFQLVGWPE